MDDTFPAHPHGRLELALIQVYTFLTPQTESIWSFIIQTYHVRLSHESKHDFYEVSFIALLLTCVQCLEVGTYFYVIGT
jgi:hypothetical protein